MARAWIITRDYLALDGGYGDQNAVDISGPRDATEEMVAQLKRGAGYAFYMSDDDGILYYRGRCMWDAETDDEEGAYGPLGDFGMPDSGCVSITYPKHPEYNCG